MQNQPMPCSSTTFCKAQSLEHQLSSSPLRETHIPYGITQCYLPPDKGENPAFTPSRSRYLIYRPRRDARLS